MDTLMFLGIYLNDIEHAAEVLEAVCDKHGIDSEAVWMNVYAYFEGGFASDHSCDGTLNFTNALITLMFNCLRDALLDVGIEDERIDWAVEGPCSDFYIDGEQAY